MDKKIPYGRQNITQEDIEAVIDVLKSDWLTQGPTINQFEEAFAEYIGCKYAVAVSNGTAALHLCTLALNVSPGQKVITTPITFAASANCVRYCGGEVIFADIDPETYLLDINKVKKLLEASPKGTYHGIIPVDFAGRANDLEAFRKLADEYDLWIIEDACHAPGGYFIDSQGTPQRCGNGTYADLAIFSFHPVKHIAAGEGGMITTNDEKLYEQLLLLRTHGITKDHTQFQIPIESVAPSDHRVTKNDHRMTSNDHRITKNDHQMTTNDNRMTKNDHQMTTNDNSYPHWYMEMQTLGYNYRLTDFQAALGLSQLKRAEVGLARRHEIAARYYKAFKDIPQITDKNIDVIRKSPFAQANREPRTANHENSHAYHLYVIEVTDRDGLFNYLRSQKIFAQVHYIPVHLMPYYRSFGWQEGDMPAAEEYYKHCLSLPMYPTLTEEEQEYVIGEVFTYYKQ